VSEPGPHLFTAAQRHSIGVAVKQLLELVEAARGLGVDGEALDELEQALERFALAAGAGMPPPPPRNRLNAVLVQMLVLEEELRPRRLAAYGDVDPEAAMLLDEHVQRLVDLTNALGDDLS
jgi:hypothetical protein